MSKTNTQIKEIEKSVQFAEAKLVTEKQVKEMIDEMVPDKTEGLKKQMQS